MSKSSLSTYFSVPDSSAGPMIASVISAWSAVGSMVFLPRIKLPLMADILSWPTEFCCCSDDRFPLSPMLAAPTGSKSSSYDLKNTQFTFCTNAYRSKSHSKRCYEGSLQRGMNRSVPVTNFPKEKDPKHTKAAILHKYVYKLLITMSRF